MRLVDEMSASNQTLYHSYINTVRPQGADPSWYLHSFKRSMSSVF